MHIIPTISVEQTTDPNVITGHLDPQHLLQGQTAL